MKVMVSTAYKRSLKDEKKTMLLDLLPELCNSLRMFLR